MSRQHVSAAGIIGVLAGVLGALSAFVLLAWPPQVAEGLVRYPFTTTGFLLAQAWFAVHHLGLLIAIVALVASGAVGSGRFARGGGWVAAAGMVLLSLAELLAMRYANWADETANAGLMGTAYGIATIVIGLGMLGAGAGVLRARVWSGWPRWTPLAIGIAVFAVVTPSTFSGFVLGRLAIALWMLLFAALGWSLHAESRRGSPTLQSTAAPLEATSAISTRQ